MARIGDLFAAEGVQYRTEGFSILSTRTPIVLHGFQRIHYSKRNWVGLNPFTYVSSVNVRCQPDQSGTHVSIKIDRFRAFVWVAFWFCSSGMAALAAPEPVGVIFFAAVSLAAWLVLVSFLGGSLVKKEIADCLNADSFIA